MKSVIDQTKEFDCPACGVLAGMECWPRSGEDVNWVHTARRHAMNAIPLAIVFENASEEGGLWR